MNTAEAFALFRNINSLASLEDEKYEAIQQVINAETINSITKKEVLNVVEWLFNKNKKYRWHDLRKNPADLPDVEHPERAWFEVVQKDNEEQLIRARMQYDDNYGFGIYKETSYDVEFTTVGEMVLAPVVAWKEIEEFEDENS